MVTAAAGRTARRRSSTGTCTCTCACTCTRTTTMIQAPDKRRAAAKDSDYHLLIVLPEHFRSTPADRGPAIVCVLSAVCCENTCLANADGNNKFSRRPSLGPVAAICNNFDHVPKNLQGDGSLWQYMHALATVAGSRERATNGDVGVAPRTAEVNEQTNKQL